MTIVNAIPAGVTFDSLTHRYTYQGRPLLSVTGVLRTAGLADVAIYTDADRQRGAAVHGAIEHYHRSGQLVIEPEWAPFLHAYVDFLTESGFLVERCEERVASPALWVGGTLDLSGRFPDTPADYFDLIDIKTSAVPEWVGYQTAGYARCLPAMMWHRAIRWCLHLSLTGRYRLLPLTKRSDDSVFLAAVTVAQAKRGWL